MAASNNRNPFTIMIILGIFFVFGILAALDIGGTFSIGTGVAEDEFEPVDNLLFDINNCRLIPEANSVMTAAQDIGAEEYYRLASTGSFTMIDGEVYLCE